MHTYPYVITVSSEKGGVGKTTLATNLAIYLKALREDLPISIFSFDNHFTVDKMFSIRGQDSSKSVADLLLETPGSDLIQTGQYGVNYIPSSSALSDLKTTVKSPMMLARLLALSQIPGILIIDTRPDLDILTQNALYAADRVIIPVKDMPSLENCRNIFALFDQRNMDKKSLILLPCLIDSRIKFDNMFKDQKTLLKAYAINRGYRCYDSIISKSPKVESLTTNPDGKVYPILTHARGTEVHQQFTLLARTILSEFAESREPRSQLFYQWLTTEEQRKKLAFSARLEGVRDACLVCGKQLLSSGNMEGAFFYTASDGGANGFIEGRCFVTFLLSAVYGLGKDFSNDDPSWLIFKESARESVFAFKPLKNGHGWLVEFHRFDLEGTQLSKKVYPLRQGTEGHLSVENNSLYSMLTNTVGGFGDEMRDAFLLVHPTSEQHPESILKEEGHKKIRRIMLRVAEQLGGKTHFTSLDA